MPPPKADPPSAEKRESCGARAVASRWNARSISILSINAPREWLSESSAPHLTSPSSTRLLTLRRSIRVQKSNSDVNGPSAARAVGLANGRNPLAIVIPCHRVIGANGSLTGYGGGLETKRWLLEHEGARLTLPPG